MSIEDELKKEIALLTRENQQLTHQLFDYRAAFIRARDREWVGLTDEEVADYWVAAFNENGLYVQTFASLIEAQLRKRNT